MELIKVAENALTVELSWSDCSLLAHLCRRALAADALHDAADFGLADGYSRAMIALFEAGGMATWAHTVEREHFTVEHFRGGVPLIPPAPPAPEPERDTAD